MRSFRLSKWRGDTFHMGFRVQQSWLNPSCDACLQEGLQHIQVTYCENSVRQPGSPLGNRRRSSSVSALCQSPGCSIAGGTHPYGRPAWRYPWSHCTDEHTCQHPELNSDWDCAIAWSLSFPVSSTDYSWYEAAHDFSRDRILKMLACSKTWHFIPFFFLIILSAINERSKILKFQELQGQTQWFQRFFHSFTCTYTHTRAHTQTHMWAYTDGHTHGHIGAHTGTYTWAYTHRQKGVHTHTHTHHLRVFPEGSAEFFF